MRTLVKSIMPSDVGAKNQSVDIVRTLVRFHRFKVRHVPPHVILVSDAVGAEDFPGGARDIECHRDIVA